ncbi:MAG: hypothetical protein ACYST3_03020 [Planctomycetota bacterium]
MNISCKLRNLKGAATRQNVPFGTGEHNSINLRQKYNEEGQHNN